jgi:hypothetical protein
VNMNEARKKLIDEATASLERMSTVDVAGLARAKDLGKDLNFEPAVEHAQRIVDLFRQISKDLLPEFSTQRLTAIKQNADAQWSFFEQMRGFSVSQPNPKGIRDGLLQQIEAAYDTVFEQIWPMIAYSVRRATDFQRLERDARASMQAAADHAAKIQGDLEERKKEAEAALDAIRKVAAEQGVSQQAIHFKTEADGHSKDAAVWLGRTQWLTVALVAYSLVALFLHRVSWLAPTNAAESAQLAIGKAMVFVTIASYLVLAARSYMAHRHNAIVNRHRQNSLATYRALVEAAGDQANRDIVLTKASESIFGPQGTGFSKIDGHEGTALSMVSVGASLAKPNSG